MNTLSAFWSLPLMILFSSATFGDSLYDLRYKADSCRSACYSRYYQWTKDCSDAVYSGDCISRAQAELQSCYASCSSEVESESDERVNADM
jgi:hypothetical protein